MDNFRISIIENKDQWEALNGVCREKTFMHSWSSKEWRKAMGQEVKLLGIWDNETLAGGVLCVTMPLIKKLGLKLSFFFIPHGPLIHPQYESRKKEILSNITSYLKDIARQRRDIIFLRIAPAWIHLPEHEDILRTIGFRPAPMFIVPEITWSLDVSQPEEKILESMRKTTRYLIRKGLNNPDLTIKKGENEEDLEIFLNLYKETVNRHDFQAFTLDYLRKELAYLKREGQILILNAFYHQEPIASAMIVFYKDTAYYHQGASTASQPKDAPGSYLIQWAAIQEAKKRNCSSYNFWGIADIETPEHAYYGLSLFKKGFGGFRTDYVPTHDIIWRWPYWFNYIIEKNRRRKRKL